MAEVPIEAVGTPRHPFPGLTPQTLPVPQRVPTTPCGTSMFGVPTGLEAEPESPEESSDEWEEEELRKSVNHHIHHAAPLCNTSLHRPYNYMLVVVISTIPKEGSWGSSTEHSCVCGARLDPTGVEPCNCGWRFDPNFWDNHD